jgi:hypothetical protein
MRFEEGAQGLAGAVEANLDGTLGFAQKGGGFFGGEFLDVAEQEDLAVMVGEFVDSRADEGLGLAGFDAGGGGEVPRRGGMGGVPVGEEGGEEGVDGAFGLSAGGAEAHEAGVDGDAVQPGAESGVVVETGDGLEGGEEGLLHGVVGRGIVAEHPAGHGVEAGGVFVEGVRPGGVVAGLQGGDEAGFGGERVGRG